ncbi:hypothetical protein J7K42_02450 [bacterium]|nr:hypothetical protein [bacterium]
MKNILKKEVKKVYSFVLVGLAAGIAIGLILQYAGLTKASPDVPNPGHPASQIEPGTFASGDYTFPKDLTVGGGDITVSKEGNYSSIYFPAQTNDPGYIQHYESNNTGRLYLMPGDDWSSSDAVIVKGTDENWAHELRADGWLGVASGIYDRTDDTLNVSDSLSVSGTIKGSYYGLGNVVEHSSSGTGYPYWSVDLGSGWSNGTKIIFGFTGKKASSGSGGPVMYVYRDDWSWSSSISLKYNNWRYGQKTVTIGGHESSNLKVSIYHHPRNSSGKSYSRGAFVNVISNP